MGGGNTSAKRRIRIKASSCALPCRVAYFPGKTRAPQADELLDSSSLELLDDDLSELLDEESPWSGPLLLLEIGGCGLRPIPS